MGTKQTSLKEDIATLQIKPNLISQNKEPFSDFGLLDFFQVK